MPDILSIINWVFLGIPGLIILINALTGFGRGTAKSITKLIRVIISVLLSALITRLLINFVIKNTQLHEMLLSLIEGFVQDAEAQNTIAEIGDISVITTYAVSIVSALLGPILFLIVYLLVSLIMLIPFAFINGALKKANINRQIDRGDVDEYDRFGNRRRIRVKKMPFSWLFGFAISAVCGAVIGCAIMCPFAGYVTAVGKYYTALEELSVEIPDETAAEAVRGAKDVQGVSLNYKVSSKLFDFLTYYNNGKEVVSVFKDVDAVVDIAPDVMSFMDEINGSVSFEEIESLDTSILKTVTAKLKESGDLKYVVVSLLKVAGTKLYEGEKFFGVDVEQMFQDLPEDSVDYVKAIFGVFADMSAEDQDSVARSLGVIDDLADGITDVLNIFDKLKTLTGADIENISDLDLTPMNEVADIISDSNSSILKEVIVKVFNDAGRKWGAGEAFFGIDIAQMAGDYSVYLNDAYDLFKNTTEQTIGDDIKSFTGAIGVFTDIFDEFKKFADITDFSDFNVISDPLNNVADILNETESTLAKNIVVAVLNDAGKKWGDGQELMGINVSSALPDGFGGYMSSAFDLLAHSTVTSVGDDIAQFGGAVSTLGDVYDEIKVLTGTTDFSDFSVISDPLNNIATIMDETESTLAKDIIVAVLNDAGKKWGDGEEFIGLDISSALPDGFGGYMSSAFTLLENTDQDKLGDDLREFSGAVSTLGDVYDEIKVLTDTTDFSDFSVLADPLENISDILEASENALSKDIVVAVLNDAGKKWNDGEEFLGLDMSSALPDGFGGYMTCAFELFENTSNDTVCGDIDTFASTITDFSGIYDAILDENTGLVANDFSDIPNIDVSSLRTMSDILDGANTITRTIVAELLSDAGTKWLDGEEFMGMNIKESLPEDYKNSLDSSLNLLASSTEENVSDNVKTFADAIEAIKNTYLYVVSLTSTEATLDEMRDNLNDVLTSITPESAEIVADAISGDVLSSIGVSDDAADAVADLISGVITGIADMSEEEKGAEAEALNNIISYVTSASDDSIENATPDDVINSVLESSIISDQIVATAEGENASFDVSEEESAAITDAIAQYELDNAGAISEEDQAVLDALKALFGYTPAP